MIHPLGAFGRWVIRVFFPLCILLFPKVWILWTEESLSWETIRRGPDFLVLAMTLSLTSLLDLIVAAGLSPLGGWSQWRKRSTVVFALALLIVLPPRILHLDAQLTNIPTFAAFRRMELAEIAGFWLACAIILMSLGTVYLEISGRLFEGHPPPSGHPAGLGQTPGLE